MQASQMVRAYALYMEEKMCVVRGCKFEYDKPSAELNSRINSKPTAALIKELTICIPQLEAGYKCTVRRAQHSPRPN